MLLCCPEELAVSVFVVFVFAGTHYDAGTAIGPVCGAVPDVGDDGVDTGDRNIDFTDSSFDIGGKLAVLVGFV